VGFGSPTSTANRNLLPSARRSTSGNDDELDSNVQDGRKTELSITAQSAIVSHDHSAIPITLTRFPSMNLVHRTLPVRAMSRLIPDLPLATRVLYLILGPVSAKLNGVHGRYVTHTTRLYSGCTDL